MLKHSYRIIKKRNSLVNNDNKKTLKYFQKIMIKFEQAYPSYIIKHSSRVATIKKKNEFRTAKEQIKTVQKNLILIKMKIIVNLMINHSKQTFIFFFKRVQANKKKKKKMLQRLLSILMLCMLVVVSGEPEPVAPPDDGYCVPESNYSSLVFVGLFSSLVFCFIGILPAFFIRTDADEEKFSKFFLMIAYRSLGGF